MVSGTSLKHVIFFIRFRFSSSSRIICLLYACHFVSSTKLWKICLDEGNDCNKYSRISVNIIPRLTRARTIRGTLTISTLKRKKRTVVSVTTMLSEVLFRLSISLYLCHFMHVFEHYQRILCTDSAFFSFKACVKLSFQNVDH